MLPSPTCADDQALASRRKLSLTLVLKGELPAVPDEEKPPPSPLRPASHLPPPTTPTSGDRSDDPFQLPPMLNRIGRSGRNRHVSVATEASGGDHWAMGWGDDCNPPSPKTNHRPASPSRPFLLPTRMQPGAGVPEGSGSVSALPPRAAYEDNVTAAVRDDSAEDGVLLTRVQLEGPAFCGSVVNCVFVLTEEVDNPDILAFLSFTWSRSLDQRNWEVVSRGVRTTDAHLYKCAADDVGHFLRCEVQLDEQPPQQTPCLVVGLSSQHKEDVCHALHEGICGFNLTQAPDNEKVHVVFARKFLKVYRKAADERMVALTKCGWNKDSFIRLDKRDRLKFELNLPTGTLSLIAPREDVRDCLACVFRAFQGMAVQDICTHILPHSVHTLWRSEELNYRDHLPPLLEGMTDVRHEEEYLEYCNAIDIDMRCHEIYKFGYFWMVSREVLLQACRTS